MDYLYVQGIPFHHSIAKSYRYRTGVPLRGKMRPSSKESKQKIKKAVKPNASDTKRLSKRAINKYLRQGIRIKQINVDNKFNSLNEEIGDIMINMVAAGEHVGDIERLIKNCERTHKMSCS